MFDTNLCISLFDGVKARWKGIEQLASLQDGKIGKHGIVLLFFLYFCNIFPIVSLFVLKGTFIYLLGDA
jgi:hypothetical protein